MVPLCEARKESVLSASGSVTVENGLPETGVQIQAGDTIKADVPKDVALADNATQLTLSVETKENTQSNITAGDNEDLLSLDVHIEGISKQNTVPITVDLGPALATGLNSTAIKLYHVEGGETVPMVYVANDKEFTEHNQFKYDPETGNLVLYLATFSEILTVTNTVNAWEGAVDTSWYTEANADNYTISNADQFAGLGKLVCDGTSFKEKTITLTNDINMGGDGYTVDGKLQFYPIGYTSAGYAGTPFEGSFDGAGHKISNVRQNTWEMIGTYDGTYYNAAMGVFGYVMNATIKNLTVDNFSCESEFGTAGVIANCADGICHFENLAITNCKPYTYNNNCAGILATDGGDPGNKFYFKNITIDNTNTIGALWGTWDGICAGIMCSLKSGTEVTMENCHVAAKLDVYNDVCGNYQYYWYRYSGMLIGRVKNTVKWNGYDIPDLSNVTTTNCTVNFGDWNDYYYCELVANSLASYTHDHQFSRLEQISTLDEIKSGETWTKAGNFLLISGDTKECYHIVKDTDGTLKQHLHTDAGEETVNGETVLKEDKQIVYLPFNQLFTGTGWGIRGLDLDDLGLEGIKVLDIKEGEEESVEKFALNMTDNACIYNQEYTVGEIFKSINSETINDESVVVSITAVDLNEAVGVYTAGDVWSNGKIKFNENFEGKVQLTIQDYQFCKPTTITLNIVNSKILDKALEATGSDSSKVGRVIFDKFLDKYIAG